MTTRLYSSSAHFPSLFIACLQTANGSPHNLSSELVGVVRRDGTETDTLLRKTRSSKPAPFRDPRFNSGSASGDAEEGEASFVYSHNPRRTCHP